MSPDIKRALELAKHTSDDLALARADTVPTRTRRLLEEFASRGILGGPMADTLIAVGADEVDERSKFVLDGVKRGANAVGLVYEASHERALRNGFSRLFADHVRTVESQTMQVVKGLPLPNAGSLESAAVNAVARRASIAGRAAETDVEHFVESLRTKQREDRASLIKGLVFGGAGGAVGGAILKAIYDSAIGLVHHH